MLYFNELLKLPELVETASIRAPSYREYITASKPMHVLSSVRFEESLDFMHVRSTAYPNSQLVDSAPPNFYTHTTDTSRNPFSPCREKIDIRTIIQIYTSA
ncbi:hypothetical protein ABW21_db0208440 [Orbilia brochopaga]|nr:hypothetical protein ABW21_db0208440 [Drechslerella brochopaga]